MRILIQSFRLQPGEHWFFGLRRVFMSISLVVIAVASIIWGISDLVKERDLVSGTFVAEYVCPSVNESSADPNCYPIGTWTSDDKQIILNAVELYSGDNQVVELGARIPAFYDRIENDSIVRTSGQITLGWIPWALAAGCLAVVFVHTIWAKLRPQDSWFYG